MIYVCNADSARNSSNETADRNKLVDASEKNVQRKQLRTVQVSCCHIIFIIDNKKYSCRDGKFQFIFKQNVEFLDSFGCDMGNPRN